MKTSSTACRLLAIAALTALALGTAAAGPGGTHGQGAGQGRAKGRPAKARIDLTNTGVDADAAGRLDLKFFPAVGKRVERSWFRFKVKRLDANASYSLWMDDPTTDLDPTLVEVTGVTVDTNDDGAANLRIDTKQGGTLPFGASLADLGGMQFELRDGSDAAVFTGEVPAIQ